MKLFIYSSQGKIMPNNLERVVEDICVTARSFNKKAGIIGMLLYENNHFLQALEGPEKIVSQLMERIKKRYTS